MLSVSDLNSNPYDLNDFCKQSGIKRQLTTISILQQIGVTKRKKRTMMKMVCSMLSDKYIFNEGCELDHSCQSRETTSNMDE